MHSAVLNWVVLVASLMGCVVCDVAPVCYPGQILCSNEEKCVWAYLLCDGNRNCVDGSDEAHCVKKCADNQLRCEDGQQCLYRGHFCDGDRDCGDGLDEKDCDDEDSTIIVLNEGLDIYLKNKTKSGLEFTNSLPLSSKMKRTGYHNALKITGLSFDFRTSTLFISDAKRPAIFAVNVTSLKLNTRELVTEHIASPMDVAFDWSSNNVYWIDSGSGMAEVVSVDTLRRVAIVRDLSYPVSIALSPNTGTMFIATAGFESAVRMYGMDGSNSRFLDSVQGTPASLALHPTQSVLYWTDPEEGTISYLNYSGSRQPKILKKNINRVMSVTVTERDIYFTSGEPVSSERVNRIKNPGWEKDEGWNSITSAKKTSGKYECLIENGGCEHLCLTSEIGRSCACALGKTLGEDGTSCS